MNRNLKISFAALIMVILFSCEEDFIPNEPGQKPKMAMICLLDNERIFKVYLTQSVSIFDNPQITEISDATVELYKNDSVIGILPFVYTDTANTFGSYQFPGFPIPGNKYSLKAAHPKYGVVTAEDWFPDIPVISSYQLVYYGDSANSYLTKFRMQFQDDGAGENFYRLNIWQEGQRFFLTGLSDTVFEDYEIFCHPELTSGALPDTIRDYEVSLLFSNRGISGASKEIDFQFTTISLKNVRWGNLIVQLGRVSPAHYEYFKTIEQYRSSSQTFNQYHVFSNISNGYGILMGQSVYSITIPVK